MATFLVWELHAGPAWDHARPMGEQSLWNEHATFMDDLVQAGFVVLGGPLDDDRVLLVVEAPSADAVRDRLARDPWMASHLVIDRIESWSIRLDSRSG
jgi:hypothetical protein